MMTTEELAWASGLFEGEGSIMVIGRGRLRVAVKMTDRDIVERFEAVMPVGKMYGPYGPHVGQPNRLPHWLWIAECEDAYDSLVLMAPWLGSRRRARAYELTGVRFEECAEQRRQLEAVA